jgi:hypothetical protein
MKLAILTSLLIFLFGCSSTDLVKVKEQNWRVKLEQFQPVGKTRLELFNWQKENDIPLDSFPHKGGVILETVEGDGLVCSKWRVMLLIEIDSNERISTYAVSSTGTCL